MSGHSKWNNIQHRKGAQDQKRAKLFTKFGREIAVAAKEAGGDPNFNPRLRLAIEKAKAGNMPKDALERAIKKGTGELDGAEYVELRYEGYGPAGTAFIVDTLTDNKNRTASEVRSTFTRRGGNLGTDGAVSWMFKKRGSISLKAAGLDPDQVMMDALEAGAEDVKEEEGYFEIITDPADFQSVVDALKTGGYEYEEAEIEMYAENRVPIGDFDTAKSVMGMFEALDDLDDVQEVWSNFDIPDDLLEKLE
ncbi:MAG: YebC/PmpR family DNA-binding transcriptional regulator [Fusobacteriaceae bacterium]|nr:YebC/PmpR family DNA-binding transcriptional regulator [Fusobacteriaceae bacterium]